MKNESLMNKLVCIFMVLCLKCEDLFIHELVYIQVYTQKQNSYIGQSPKLSMQMLTRNAFLQQREVV